MNAILEYSVEYTTRDPFVSCVKVEIIFGTGSCRVELIDANPSFLHSPHIMTWTQLGKYVNSLFSHVYTFQMSKATYDKNIKKIFPYIHADRIHFVTFIHSSPDIVVLRMFDEPELADEISKLDEAK